MDRIIKNIARITQPHLGRFLFNRPSTDHWTERGAEIPLMRPFGSGHFMLEKPFKREEYCIDTDSRRPYRILCIDGGGVRGALTTSLLVRLQRHNPKFLDSVDLIVGTSAGGILGLLLASGYSAQECDDIYSFASPHIFAFNPWRAMNPFRSKYSDKQKQEIFQYYYGERTMDDLKKNAAVISFRLDGRKSTTHSFFNKEGWRPAVFSNLPDRTNGGDSGNGSFSTSNGSTRITSDSDLKVWDAAMRTSAAPTFFPVFKGYTDGGIVANNPSIVAVSKAMAHYPFLSSSNISVLSLGAGFFPRHTNVFSAGTHNAMYKESTQLGESAELLRADWGIKQWVPFLLDLLLDGDTITTEMVMQYLLGNNKLYHRLDPSLPFPVALDEVSSAEKLKAFAQTVDISETLKFIETNFTDDFVNNKGDHAHEAVNSLDSSLPYHQAWEQALFDSSLVASLKQQQGNAERVSWASAAPYKSPS